MARFLVCLLCLSLIAAAPAQKTDPTPDPAPSSDAVDPTQIADGQKVANAPIDIDPLLDKELAVIADFESAQFQKLGGYGQVLNVFQATPVDGVAKLPDLLSAKPDQGVTGAEFWQAANLQAFPANLRVDVYDGPSGLGYVIRAEAKFNGQLWQRAINFGPEAYRDLPWTAVEPGP